MSAHRWPRDSITTGAVFIVGHKRWPSPRVLLAWLRQGRPRDFPVILRHGTITGTYDGEALRAVKFTDWSFSHHFQGDGVIDARCTAQQLIDRYGIDATMPDGSTIHATTDLSAVDGWDE